MTIDDINRYRIILASRSPRRQQLLTELGLKFEIVIKDWAEDYPPTLKGEEIALFVAERKADYFRPDIKSGEIVITADTIVWCDDKVLDKPDGYQEATRILNEISGKTHEVITGVCLLALNKKRLFSSTTKVIFEKMTTGEIDYYVREFKPFDKAGAYGIQEWIGISACSRIEGSYFNVMGLPVHMVYHELKKFISD